MIADDNGGNGDNYTSIPRVQISANIEKNLSLK